MEVDKVKGQFVNYWAYSHLKDLYNKVMPAIKGFENDLTEISKEQQRSKEMIERYLNKLYC